MDVVKSLKQVQYTIGDREGSVDLTSTFPKLSPASNSRLAVGV